MFHVICRGWLFSISAWWYSWSAGRWGWSGTRQRRRKSSWLTKTATPTSARLRVSSRTPERFWCNVTMLPCNIHVKCKVFDVCNHYCNYNHRSLSLISNISWWASRKRNSYHEQEQNWTAPPTFPWIINHRGKKIKNKTDGLSTLTKQGQEWIRESDSIQPISYQSTDLEDDLCYFKLD